MVASGHEERNYANRPNIRAAVAVFVITEHFGLKRVQLRLPTSKTRTVFKVAPTYSTVLVAAPTAERVRLLIASVHPASTSKVCDLNSHFAHVP